MTLPACSPFAARPSIRQGCPPDAWHLLAAVRVHGQIVLARWWLCRTRSAGTTPRPEATTPPAAHADLHAGPCQPEAAAAQRHQLQGYDLLSAGGDAARIRISVGQHSWVNYTWNASSIASNPNYKGGQVGFALIGNSGQCTQTKYSEADLNVISTKYNVPWVTTLIYQSTVEPERLLHRVRGPPDVIRRLEHQLRRRLQRLRLLRDRSRLPGRRRRLPDGACPASAPTAPRSARTAA